MRNRGDRIRAQLIGFVGVVLTSLACACADDRAFKDGTATKPELVKSSVLRDPFESPIQYLREQCLISLIQQGAGLAPSNLSLSEMGRVSRSSSPLRQITLLGGERFLAEIVRWKDQEAVELRLPGGQSVRLALTAIESIGVPPGELELVYEPFDQAVPGAVTADVDKPSTETGSLDAGCAAGGDASLRLASVPDPVVYRFPGLPDAARVQFWFRVGDRSNSDDGKNATVPDDSSSLGVEFDFQRDAESTWRMDAGRDQVTMGLIGPSAASATRQTVRHKPGWHCLTAVFWKDHAFCVVDDTLLVSTIHSPGLLRSIRFTNVGSAWIDDLQVSQLKSVGDLKRVRASTQDDCLETTNGDEWFGRVNQVTADSVWLKSGAGDRRFPWPDVNQVVRCQSDLQVASSQWNRGTWARITQRRYLDRPQESDRFVAAITRVDQGAIVVLHPWLGRLAFPWNQIARIERLFQGDAMTIDARTIHLGDSIREDFDRPVPDGTEWTAEFELPMAPAESTEVWLSLDAVDLEPAGAGTPPGSPFLKDLRSGRLLTEITVNEQPAGDLNRWIRFRASPGHPDRVRCRIPAGVLKPGRNGLSLRQLPLKPSGTGFDNCQLSNFRLEFTTPVNPAGTN